MYMACCIVIKTLRQKRERMCFHLFKFLWLKFVECSMEHENFVALFSFEIGFVQFFVIFSVQHSFFSQQSGNLCACFLVNGKPKTEFSFSTFFSFFSRYTLHITFCYI